MSNIIEKVFQRLQSPRIKYEPLIDSRVEDGSDSVLMEKPQKGHMLRTEDDDLFQLGRTGRGGRAGRAGSLLRHSGG